MRSPPRERRSTTRRLSRQRQVGNCGERECETHSSSGRSGDKLGGGGNGERHRHGWHWSSTGVWSESRALACASMRSDRGLCSVRANGMVRKQPQNVVMNDRVNPFSFLQATPCRGSPISCPELVYQLASALCNHRYRVKAMQYHRLPSNESESDRPLSWHPSRHPDSPTSGRGTRRRSGCTRGSYSSSGG